MDSGVVGILMHTRDLGRGYIGRGWIEEGRARELRDAVGLEVRDQFLRVLDGRLGVVRGRGRRLGVHAPGEVREHLLREQHGLEKQ